MAGVSVPEGRASGDEPACFESTWSEGRLGIHVAPLPRAFRADSLCLVCDDRSHPPGPWGGLGARGLRVASAGGAGGARRFDVLASPGSLAWPLRGRAPVQEVIVRSQDGGRRKTTPLSKTRCHQNLPAGSLRSGEAPPLLHQVVKEVRQGQALIPYFHVSKGRRDGLRRLIGPLQRR